MVLRLRSRVWTWNFEPNLLAMNQPKTIQLQMASTIVAATWAVDRLSSEVVVDLNHGKSEKPTATVDSTS